MRTLPASYQLANVNLFIKNVSLTMVDVVERKKEALLRLELPMMRSNVTVKVSSFFLNFTIIYSLLSSMLTF